MSLKEISDSAPILSAIEEFDTLGREAFLKKYGFGPSRSYWLVHNGRLYDSKPIIGAAHGFARPDLGPLRAADFSGGDDTVRRKLEQLGFSVSSDDQSDRVRDAFLLTWKQDGWDHSNILRMLETFRRQGYVDEPWRIRSHRRAKVGDRAWALKQGFGPKVIFGKGEILAAPTLGDSGDGKMQMMAPVRFHQFVDPLNSALVDEEDTRLILGDKIAAQASGDPLLPPQAEALELVCPDPSLPDALIAADEADDNPFDPTSLEDARERIARSIAVRRGQARFRKALFSAYDGRCAITDCDVPEVLDAAHIVPYRGEDTNRVVNGLLLRTDVHTLFDCDLIQINPDGLIVAVAPGLRPTVYGALHGRKISLPVVEKDRPSLEALRFRWTNRWPPD